MHHVTPTWLDRVEFISLSQDSSQTLTWKVFKWTLSALSTAFLLLLLHNSRPNFYFLVSYRN